MTENGSPADAHASTPATELPDKMRVHALARLLGSTSREVLNHLEALGSAVRSASSTINREVAEQVVARVGGPAVDAVAPAVDALHFRAAEIHLDPSINAATEANALVVKEGIPFREAYRRVAARYGKPDA